ncbi:MAG: neutral/alkaline non-lysosomal ceramidase N-terminal domain-containing protein [Terriglobia bacterium]
MDFQTQLADFLKPANLRSPVLESLVSHLSSLLLGLACFVIFLLPAAMRGESLKAGVARVDITPPVGVRMWGYQSRKGPSIGTRDPLYARVLVLEAGGKRLAFAILDLGRDFGPASLAKLKAATRSDVNYLVTAAIHTHSGPFISDEYPGGTPAWETADLGKIASAVHMASSHLVDAKLGVGYGAVYIGHNRLRRNPDGTVSWFQRNPTRIPTAPVDPTVAVLRVDTADGKPLAILVYYACHAVVFGPSNLKYSADYPGVMDRVVRQAFGGQPLAFFVQGAAGDINPYYAVTPLQQDAVRDREWTGRRLGEEAARVARNIHTESVPDPSIQFAEDYLTFHLRWNARKWRQALIASYGPAAAQHRRVQTVFKAPVTTILINKRIAILGMPGEPFIDFQKSWRDRCPVWDCLFMGYTNGYFGYLPTMRAASWGGYGAGNDATRLEVGAGNRMLEGARQICEMKSCDRLHSI